MSQPFLHRVNRRRADLMTLAAMGGLYFFAYFQRVGLTATLFNQVQADFQVSASVVTGLTGLYMLIYAVMQLVVGVSADRFGPRWPLLVGGLLLSAGSLLLPMAHDLWGLYAARLVVALGDSFVFLCIVKQVDRLFGERHFAPLVGMLLFVGYTGALTAMTPLAALAQAMGWRNAMLLAGVLCTAMFVLACAVLMRGDARPAGPQTASKISLRAVRQFFANRRVYPNLIYGPLNFGIYMLVQMTIGKKFLQDRFGLSSIAASNVTFAMQLIVMAGASFSGFLPRLIGQRRKPILLASTGLIVAGSAMLWLGVTWHLPLAWFVAAYLLLAAAMVSGVVGTAIFKEINDPAVTAFAIGFANMVTYMAVSAIASMAGPVMDAFAGGAQKVGQVTVYPAQAYGAIFAIVAGLSVISLLAALKMPETRGVQYRPAEDI